MSRASAPPRAVARALREDRGAAMLEFAIVAPLLVTLLFGVIDAGRYFFLYNAVLNAARDGARLAAVTPMGTATEVGAATTLVVNTVRGRIPDAQAPAAAVAVALQGAAPAQSVRVTVTGYPFARIVPFAVPTRLPQVRAEFRHEYQ